VAVTDRAGRVTATEYWPTGQVKKRIGPDGNFVGYEYDIEGRVTKVWASVPELNSSQTEGPFGESENVALIKTIEYKTGIRHGGPSGTGEAVTRRGGSGTTLSAGS